MQQARPLCRYFSAAIQNVEEWSVSPPCATNKRTDGVLGDLLPDLVQGVTDFPARMKPKLSVPELFHWI